MIRIMFTGAEEEVFQFKEEDYKVRISPKERYVYFIPKFEDEDCMIIPLSSIRTIDGLPRDQLPSF